MSLSEEYKLYVLEDKVTGQFLTKILGILEDTWVAAAPLATIGEECRLFMKTTPDLQNANLFSTHNVATYAFFFPDFRIREVTVGAV